MRDKIRILMPEWHQSMQYDLSKLPNTEFYLFRTGDVRYDTKQRPLRENVHLISKEDILADDYDLTIIPIDDHTENLERWEHWGWMRELKLPKIVQFHGTPKDRATAEEIKTRVGWLPVVCNNEIQNQMVGFYNSTIIQQGIDPKEFTLTNYEKGAVTNIPHNAAGDKMHNGKCILDSIRKWVGVDCIRDYNCESYGEYRREFAKHSVYVNPTIYSANPRSRLEAMMSGMAVVSTSMMGEENYLNSEGISYSNNPYLMARDIKWLLRNEDKLMELGLKNRQFAIKHNSIKRYLQEWQDQIRITTKR